MASDTNILPSQKIYEEINKRNSCFAVPGGSGKCCMNGNGYYLDDTLKIYGYIDDKLAKKITAVWHHAPELGNGDNLTDSDRCKFLFFWTGSQINSRLSSLTTTFGNAMSTVYTQLRGYHCIHKCTLSYDGITSGLMFKWAKDLWDYYYDYSKLNGKEGVSEQPICKALKTKFERAKQAHSYLQSSCDSSPYCNAFNNGKSTTNAEFAAPKELKCKGDEETIAAEEEIMEVTSPPELGGKKLGELPSRLLYEKFESKEGKGKGKCGSTEIQSVKDALKAVLEDYSCVGDCTEKVLYSWCYADKEKDSTLYGEPFNFFYLWLWQELLKHGSAGNSFSPIAKRVYGALRDISPRKNCEDMWEGIYLDRSSDDFYHRKALYEYFVDYDTLIRHLGNGSVPKQCDSAYHQHLEQIKKACPALQKYCIEGERDSSKKEYCKWFNEHQNKSYCDNGALTKLKCTKVRLKPNPNPNQAGSSGSFSESGGHHNGVPGGEGKGGSDGGSIVGSVSGGLATVGLPTIAYLIYKVSKNRGAKTVKKQNSKTAQNNCCKEHPNKLLLFSFLSLSFFSFLFLFFFIPFVFIPFVFIPFVFIPFVFIPFVFIPFLFIPFLFLSSFSFLSFSFIFIFFPPPFFQYKPQLFSFGRHNNRSFGHGRNGLNRNGQNRGRSTLRSELNTSLPDDHDTSTIGGSDSMTDTSNYSLPYTTSSYR
ncbi:KIR protein [Plasmodium knowlesi strain H]|uniref:KIR protein n=1 Tax=Plasmodium knowlesi (strain H) TaxID=5851 RepID=A0A193R6W4_PLAKH|nr:KIR protein [Plasmodium knowlesi strain H]SBO28916.1 KIR protein [Plasmodium knowlesi strain H]